MQIKISTFAQLKDFFEKDFSIDVPESSSVKDVMQYLINLKPDARNLLNSSRVAINEKIVQLEFALQKNDSLFLLPPASGG